MRRPLITLLTTVTALALSAAAAVAESDVGHDGGEGWWGETNDKIVTNFGFLLIGIFPLLVLILSLIQWRLEKRKTERLKAAKVRAARADERLGW